MEHLLCNDAMQLVQSSGHSVVLTNVASSASGHYKCEISAEAPSFETDTREAILHVVGQCTCNHSITF